MGRILGRYKGRRVVSGEGRLDSFVEIVCRGWGSSYAFFLGDLCRFIVGAVWGL